MTAVQDLLPEPADEEELFVAFANTIELSKGVPQEALPDIDALLDWLARRGLLSSRARAAERARLRRDPEEGERRLERFRHLRSILHDVAGEVSRDGHPSAALVRELNHILRHGLHYHQLLNDAGGNRYTVAQVGDRLDQARATIAGSFAHFLAEDNSTRLRVCANEGCRWVFVDRSPTGRRRWCDMRTCGNQAKVARHRARTKAKDLKAKDSGVPAAAAGG
jgi:predicted RNA-binding Zn ribbon-like protein